MDKKSIMGVFLTKKNQNVINIEKLFNFDRIPEKELEEQYIDLSFIVSSSGYGGLFMSVNGRILKEEAISTLSIENTKEVIKLKFNLKDWQFATQQGTNSIQLMVLYPNISQNTKLIKDAMLACGWSFSVKSYIKENNMIYHAMTFEPMFQNDISTEARQCRYLFHWTPKYNLESIIQNGLLPRSENKLFKHSNRIYLIKGGATQNEIFYLGRHLCSLNKNKKNNGEYILLSVDLTKISKETEIYYDPRYQWGYYLKVPIEPNAIKPIFGINFKTNAEISIEVKRG